MVKTMQIRRFQVLQKLGIHVVAMRNPTQMSFYQSRFKNDSFYFGTRFGYVKNHKLSVTVFSTIHRVKPAWPAEPILLTTTLLTGALPGDAGKAGQ